MNKKRNIIEEQIGSYLDKSMPDSERVGFLSLLEENEEYRTLFEEYKDIWDKAENTGVFSELDSRTDWGKVMLRMDTSDNNKRKTITISGFRNALPRIAAIALILLATAFILSRFVFTRPEIIMISSMDDRRNIILPDGSSVYLNSYSSIEYPERFRGNLRYVKLEGEAYFEIEKDPGKLFRVNAGGGAYIDVLGTKFNIEINNKLKQVNVGVLTGRVAFYALDHKEDKLLLRKDDQAVLRNGEVRKSEDQDNNFLSWKSGTLVFQDDKLEKVIDDLASHFSKNIIFENKSKQTLRITSTFENQDMDSILEELKLILGVNYTVNGDTISIYIE